MSNRMGEGTTIPRFSSLSVAVGRCVVIRSERGIAKYLTIDRVCRCPRPPNVILSNSRQIVRAARNLRDKAPKNGLAAICLLLGNLLPFGAGAQVTEPLLPVPAPPSGPQAPALPGQPTYPGQTVTQRPRPESQPVGLRVGDFF